MINNTLDVLWGTNGSIWIQRKLKEMGGDEANNLAYLQEQLRQEHAKTPVLPDERQAIARLRNAIECLRLVHSMVTPEFAEEIYNRSVTFGLSPSQMLLPQNVVSLTEICRQSSTAMNGARKVEGTIMMDSSTPTLKVLQLIHLRPTKIKPAMRTIWLKCSVG